MNLILECLQNNHVSRGRTNGTIYKLEIKNQTEWLYCVYIRREEFEMKSSSSLHPTLSTWESSLFPSGATAWGHYFVTSAALDYKEYKSGKSSPLQWTLTTRNLMAILVHVDIKISISCVITRVCLCFHSHNPPPPWSNEYSFHIRFLQRERDPQLCGIKLRENDLYHKFHNQLKFTAAISLYPLGCSPACLCSFSTTANFYKRTSRVESSRVESLSPFRTATGYVNIISCTDGWSRMNTAAAAE